MDAYPTVLLYSTTETQYYMTDDFEQSVAHAARDRTRIAIRWMADRFYGATRRSLREVNPRIEAIPETLVLYPVAEDIDRAADLFNRMNWYLGTLDVRAVLLTPYNRPDLRELVQSLDNQRTYPETDQVNTVPPEKAKREVRRADRILIWDWRTLFRPEVLTRLHKTILVDPHFYSNREVTEWYKEVCTRKKQRESRKINEDKFRQLQNKFAEKNEAYVFATGPSLDTVYDHPIPDETLRVICNSIVRNDELLEYLDPDILTFNDPVFHFGPSKYAAQFRDDAARTLRNYDCWCVVSTPGDDILRSQFPDIKDRIIGISGRGDLDHFHTPSPSELFVRPTGNIMTLFMLPVAAALADSINVVGADGRDEDASYFWKHSSAAQYEGLMNSAVKTHPSFFRDRLYEDYYDRHVSRLRELIESQEARGKVYRSITPSYIPVLKERE